MKTVSRWLAVMLLLAAAGCSIFNLPGISSAGGGTTTPTKMLTVSTPTPQVTPTESGPLRLTLWLPPKFDPQSGTLAGNLLKERLAEFGTNHPDVELEVRIKAVEGVGGLLETLRTASSVAPGAVPSLIALPRADLETAALSGLIYPYPENAGGLQGDDWFDYARDISQVQGAGYSLPFAGDALVLLYRPVNFSNPPQTWDEILMSGQRLAVPAGDPQAVVSLALYLSGSGLVQNEQGRPQLEAEVLQKVLNIYSRGLGLGVILPGMVDMASDGLAWQTYKDGGAQMVITWANRYLAEPPADTTAGLLPSLSGQPYALADGWSWAVADPQPARRLLAVELAEFLTDADFLAEWSEASGTLVVRPSSLEGWADFYSRDLARTFAQSAQLRPSSGLASSLAPALQEAVRQVLTRQSDPMQAANTAAEKVAKPYQP